MHYAMIRIVGEIQLVDLLSMGSKTEVHALPSTQIQTELYYYKLAQQSSIIG